MSTTSASNSAICWPSKYGLKWAVVFFGSLIFGGILALIRPKPAPAVFVPAPHPIAIKFVAYDTQGRPVKAVISEGATDNTGTKLTKEMNVDLQIVFKRTDNGEITKEQVKWLSAEEYRTWLDGTFRKTLVNIDPGYNRKAWENIIKGIKSNIGPADHEYPVVFKAH